METNLANSEFTCGILWPGDSSLGRTVFTSYGKLYDEQVESTCRTVRACRDWAQNTPKVYSLIECDPPSDWETADQLIFNQYDVPEALAIIRHCLGLNTTQLSQIMEKSRTAIYDWLNGKPLKPENLERVGKILEIAKSWDSKGLGPLAMISSKVDGEVSLLELLTRESLDVETIEKFLDRLGSEQKRIAAKKLPSLKDLKNKGYRPLDENARVTNVKIASRRSSAR